ncbi:MAG: universal stress protein [Nitrosomonas sp.]|nr:universal stress protein [Nitrosomonas sp.]MCW5607325.1 universal stress protein [Nitrosomonas sp.]
MNDYKKILVAIDFSDYGNIVINQAKHLAGKLNAELSVIHVLDNIPMPDTPYGTIITLSVQSGDPLLEAEKNKFNQVCDDLGVISTGRWLIWGKPQEEITGLAAKEKIDLIIVGSHGHHGLAALMGSTAKGVIFNAECDVLTVHLKDNQ